MAAVVAVAAAHFAVAAPGDWTLSKTANPTTYSAAGQVINYTYVIVNHTGLDGTLFSGDGDSGALIVERGSNAAVGLLIGGSGDCTIANHIDDVLESLNVSLV